jgi:hypothetical protein
LEINKLEEGEEEKVNGRPLPAVRSKYRPPLAPLTGNRPTAGGQRGSASAGDVTTRSSPIGHLETVNNTTTLQRESKPKNSCPLMTFEFEFGAILEPNVNQYANETAVKQFNDPSIPSDVVFHLASRLESWRTQQLHFQ